jgi:putative transposase
MPTKKSQFDKNVFYFFTITCYKWLNLFEITNFYGQIYNWFDILKSYGIKTVSYVVMPNHLHAIIFFPDNIMIKSRLNKRENKIKSVNQIIGTGKRFMAYEIVKRLKIKNENNVLDILSDGVNELERKKRKLHQVFQPSFDLKILLTEKFLVQKINYIHKNPVAKKWNLVDDYRKYKYSSAGYYELEDYQGYEVEHYLKVV